MDNIEFSDEEESNVEVVEQPSIVGCLYDDKELQKLYTTHKDNIDTHIDRYIDFFNVKGLFNIKDLIAFILMNIAKYKNKITYEHNWTTHPKSLQIPDVHMRKFKDKEISKQTVYYKFEGSVTDLKTMKTIYKRNSSEFQMLINELYDSIFKTLIPKNIKYRRHIKPLAGRFDLKCLFETKTKIIDDLKINTTTNITVPNFKEMKAICNAYEKLKISSTKTRTKWIMNSDIDFGRFEVKNSKKKVLKFNSKGTLDEVDHMQGCVIKIFHDVADDIDVKL